MQSAYEMTTEEILSKLSPEIAEVHITGGMPADWPWERYLDIVRSIHEKFPNADVKAYTAVEIDFFHKKFKISIEEVLKQLKAVGLRTMPGGGAEVFSSVSANFSSTKRSGQRRGLKSTKPHTNSASRRTQRCSTVMLRRSRNV